MSFWKIHCHLLLQNKPKKANFKSQIGLKIIKNLSKILKQCPTGHIQEILFKPLTYTALFISYK